MSMANGMLLRICLRLWILSHKILSFQIRLHRRSTARLVRSLENNPRLHRQIPLKIREQMINEAEVFALCFGMESDDAGDTLHSERVEGYDLEGPGENWN